MDGLWSGATQRSHLPSTGGIVRAGGRHGGAKERDWRQGVIGERRAVQAFLQARPLSRGSLEVELRPAPQTSDPRSGGKRLIATTVRTRTATGRSSIHRTTSGGTSTGLPERGSLVWAASRSSTSSGPRLSGLACRNACTARRSPIKLSPLRSRGLRADLPCAVRPFEGRCDPALPPVRNVSMDVACGT